MQKQDLQLWQSSWNWSSVVWSAIILIVLSTVNLHFQGWSVPISLRPFLGMMVACVTSSQVVLVVKNLPASSGDLRDRFDPWVRKIPWRRAWQPTPVFLPGGPHVQRSLVGFSPWVTQSRTQLKWLNMDACHGCSLGIMLLGSYSWWGCQYL